MYSKDKVSSWSVFPWNITIMLVWVSLCLSLTKQQQQSTDDLDGEWGMQPLISVPDHLFWCEPVFGHISYIPTVSPKSSLRKDLSEGFLANQQLLRHLWTLKPASSPVNDPMKRMTWHDKEKQLFLFHQKKCSGEQEKTTTILCNTTWWLTIQFTCSLPIKSYSRPLMLTS